MKKNIALLFGGVSAEHEVSIASTRNVYLSLDKNKFNPFLIGIDFNGYWYIQSESQFMKAVQNKKIQDRSNRIVLIPTAKGCGLFSITRRDFMDYINCVFPVLHGPYGEDGSMQGYLKILNIPFVGAGVLASAMAMDKEVTKRLFQQEGIPQADYLCFTDKKKCMDQFDLVRNKLGLPIFVKPCNLGSSVAVNKVEHKEQYKNAVEEAFSYDRKIILEKYIQGREIECSVLGNADPLTSVPGEVIPQHKFYSYQAKYIDEKGAKFNIPVKLDGSLIEHIQSMAVRVYILLNCEGMARIDFFLTPDNQVLVNEVNTIPGFTGISMYPKLWETQGLSNRELVTRLIELAEERFNRENNLRHDYAKLV
ncbi:MAG: hypothetical protein APR63_10120 [Desulfuromonas sp. SDB]|nr:MAG: hypothetical protein APR63_10120 [Desulfuromonas sp. SDB]